MNYVVCIVDDYQKVCDILFHCFEEAENYVESQSYFHEKDGSIGKWETVKGDNVYVVRDKDNGKFKIAWKIEKISDVDNLQSLLEDK